MSISEKKDGGGVSVFMNLEREANVGEKYRQEVPGYVSRSTILVLFVWFCCYTAGNEH
jgi:hypothetical protein